MPRESDIRSFFGGSSTKSDSPKPYDNPATQKKKRKSKEDRVYTDTILTIKPEFAQMIEKREKNHEYRKYELRDTVERLWLYETAPTSALTYVFSSF